jgi:hypothetical protein
MDSIVVNLRFTRLMPIVAVPHKDFLRGARRSALSIDRMKSWQQRNQINHFNLKTLEH